MQPNPNLRQPRALQVDIQEVIEAEAGAYTRMIADLTRQNAVLSIALRDRENEIAELQSKVRALTGGPAVMPGGHFAPMPVGGGATLPSSGRVSIPESVFADTDAAPAE